MSFWSYRRLEHELYWGYRLFLMREKYRSSGFRGKAKGQGFRAYLTAEKIPARLAYRLIQRYMRVSAIWARVHVRNAEYEPDDKMPEWLKGQMFMSSMMQASIRDRDSDTNGEVLSRAEQCRIELDTINDTDSDTND